MLTDTWTKPSRCADGQSCVEVRRVGDVVQIRHSKRPDDATIDYTLDEWNAFIAAVELGQFRIG